MTDIQQAKAPEIYALYQRQDPATIWIDVRQPEDWAEGTIPGAERISLAELPERLGALDSDKAYVLVCRSGGRSGRASQLMAAAGFEKLINFDGGMLAWQAAGYPLAQEQP